MPTSTTQIYKRIARSGGFTLLEVLVVLTIVAVLTGTVMLSFTGGDAEQSLKGAAQRMSVRIEMARHHALQRNREWGIYITEDAYSFAEFDPLQRQWVPQDSRQFNQTDLPERVTLRLSVENLEDLPFDEEDGLPQIIVFSSGEVTPFTVFLEPDWDTLRWLVSSDGLSRTTAERDGDRA